jgi:argininosuccinate lyase
VGRIVKHCLSRDLDLRSLSREDLQAFHPAFPASAAELLSLDRALEERGHIGGTSRQRVIEALDAADARIARETGALDARREER